MNIPPPSHPQRSSWNSYSILSSDVHIVNTLATPLNVNCIKLNTIKYHFNVSKPVKIKIDSTLEYIFSFNRMLLILLQCFEIIFSTLTHTCNTSSDSPCTVGPFHAFSNYWTRASKFLLFFASSLLRQVKNVLWPSSTRSRVEKIEYCIL